MLLGRCIRMRPTFGPVDPICPGSPMGPGAPCNEIMNSGIRHLFINPIHNKHVLSNLRTEETSVG